VPNLSKNRRSLFGVAAGAIGTAFVVGVATWAAGETSFAAGCLMGAALAALILAGVLMSQERRETVARAEDSEQNLRLAEQLITAEQDERRRLSVLLHDGPLQELSGVALMHDAALSAFADDRPDEAHEILTKALEHERSTIQKIRDLSFAIEPIILRDYGFEAAVRAIGDQLERGGTLETKLDVVAGELLAEKMQVALYQTVREALAQSARREPTTVSVTIERAADRSFVLEVVDDGHRERRRRNVESLEERARLLQGNVSLDSADTGTKLVITLPAIVGDPIHDTSPISELANVA
jgi:signal transduction histidine kinase